MKFKYTIYDQNGKKVKGEIEAIDLKEAKEKLKPNVILDIKEAKSFNLSFSKSVKKSELSKMFNVLGLYLKANIPLITALNLTKNQIENSRLVKFLDYLIKEIKEGKNLHQSIETQKIIKISPYVLSSIKVGEESGKLAIVLIEISKFLKDEEKIASKTLNAMIYPIFIIFVAIIMVSFMLTTVVPKIVRIFQDMHQNLPTITKIVIAMGNFLKQNGIVLIVLIIAAILIFSLLYSKNKKFKLFIDTLLLKIPVFNKIVITKNLGRFSYLTYVLTNSGVNFITAIKLATNTIDNEKMKKVFETALKDVIEGKKLSTSLKKAGFNFDKSFLQSIALIEETSEVSEILQNISEIYFEENDNRITMLLNMIEPILIIVIGGAIGFIITALLLPMMSMNILKQ